MIYPVGFATTFIGPRGRVKMEKVECNEWYCETCDKLVSSRQLCKHRKMHVGIRSQTKFQKVGMRMIVGIPGNEGRGKTFLFPKYYASNKAK